MLSRLRAEPGALRSVQAKDSEAIQLRMLVHSRLCGTLIGKGGATIRSFNEDSHAMFNISPPPTMPGLTERIVKITGETDSLMRAVALVVTKLSENPDYHLLTDANLSYSSRTAHAAPYGAPMGGPQPTAALYGAPRGPEPHLLHHPGGSAPSAPGGHAPYHDHHAPPAGIGRPVASITIGLPEDRVGVVIGKGGQVRMGNDGGWCGSRCGGLCAGYKRGCKRVESSRVSGHPSGLLSLKSPLACPCCSPLQVINQIKELMGVSIRISRKGEFLPGSADHRSCTISGDPAACELARQFIQNKVDMGTA